MSSKILTHTREMREQVEFGTAEQWDFSDSEACDLSTVESVPWESDDERQEREILAMLHEEWDPMNQPWPLKKIAYPSVKFMVDHHAARPEMPKPLLERHHLQVKQYKDEKDKVWQKQKDLKKKMDEAEKALKDEESKPKSFGQKWSQKINGGLSDEMKHLKIKHEKAIDDYNKAKNELDTFEEKYSAILQLVSAHKDTVKTYEACILAEKRMNRAMVGLE